MSEQMGMLFFVLFVVAAALCVYLSLSMSRARYFGERPARGVQIEFSPKAASTQARAAPLTMFEMARQGVT